MEPIEYSVGTRLGPNEFIEFLERTDLGEQFPEERFDERIAKLLSNADVTVTARNESGLLVGVALAVTDFAYFAFLTDLGVDRSYLRRGIGRKLIDLAHEAAGGMVDVTLVAIAADEASSFYDSCGVFPDESLRVRWSEDEEDAEE